MKRVKVLFFATLKTHSGVDHLLLEIPENADVMELKSLIQKEIPSLNTFMDSVLVSINQEFAFDKDIIPSEAEVALFPPVSGGSRDDLPTIIEISESEIDIDDFINKITLPSSGAVCIFTGIVRSITTRFKPQKTEYLEYETYQSMAEAKMLQVVDEIRAEWPSVEGIAIVQRTGIITPGVASVLIACSAAHRDTGIFEAASYGIDRLKEIVPVWKKEVSPEGEYWVEGDYKPKYDD